MLTVREESNKKLVLVQAAKPLLQSRDVTRKKEEVRVRERERQKHPVSPGGLAAGSKIN